MIDRPDNMATYTTTIIADKKSCPGINCKYASNDQVILSNGNLIANGQVEDNPELHYTTWQDPWPKPT